jgi:hypothetical protein
MYIKYRKDDKKCNMTAMPPLIMQESGHTDVTGNISIFRTLAETAQISLHNVFMPEQK